MKKLTYESILKAIEIIDINPQLFKGRESFLYDLVFENRKYPPILVLSEANKLLGGDELTIRNFNNNTKRAFKILTDLGFSVKHKNEFSPRVWFVCQGGTYNETQGKKYLWAPTMDKNRLPKFYWDNLKDVRKKDIIIHYSRGVRGISVAKEDFYDSDNSDSESGWAKHGYKVDIDFFEFDRIITLDEIKGRKNDLDFALRNVAKKPFNRDGNVNQGYLYEFTEEAAKTILEIYGKNIGNAYIDNFFDKIVFVKGFKKEELIDNMSPFKLAEFISGLRSSNLLFSDSLTIRFIASLLTKPFVILSGLSGSGKTKLAQAFAQWICQDESQYCIVPVGADWTNREPLLGYPNALKPDEYIKPDNGALDVIINANSHPDLPHFLILDEMNLSHVERYFADFLSVMESKGEISLFAEGTVNNGVPAKLPLPANLFIIGTVNIDETTYMFSPKVLDRANAIEFRVTKDEIARFFANQKDVDLDRLKTKGASMAQSFLKMAAKREFGEQDLAETHRTLVSFFEQLKKTGAEFGYRSATEIIRLMNQLSVVDSNLSENEKLDIAIMQKLLPKLHGSRRKLCPVLITLGGFCVDKVKYENIEKDIFSREDFVFETEGVIFPISLEKITRMYTGAIENGFASYAEA